MPKTGTTFLHRIMWQHRDTFAAAGFLYRGARSARMCGPGSACAVRRGPHRQHRPRVVAADPGRLAGRRQEPVAVRFDDDVAEIQEPTLDEHRLGRMCWQMQDAVEGLARWSRSLPPEQIHVATVPARADPPDELWRGFASVVGIEADVVDPSRAFQNTSLGVAETTFLRRLNTARSGSRLGRRPVGCDGRRSPCCSNTSATRGGRTRPAGSVPARRRREDIERRRATSVVRNPDRRIPDQRRGSCAK